MNRNEQGKDMLEVAEEVVAGYTSVLDKGKAMLEHATQGAWDELLDVQGHYVRDIEALAALEYDIELAPDYSDQKRDLLLQIRAAEDSVRGLLDKRMTELSESMAQGRSQRRVQQAYETG